LQPPTPPPGPPGRAPLAAVVRARLPRRRGRGAAAAVLARRLERLAGRHADVAARLGRVGVCPLCGGDLRSETFLDAGKRTA